MNQNKRPKRVAAIHDLSSFGRCALAVIIPPLSALGIQVCPVPTTVLSTHTGGFSDIAAHPCPEFPRMAANHWKACGVALDCIYSGYLGDAGQARQVVEFGHLWPDALRVVDPVLGDDGALYQGISSALVEEMRQLCTQADLITPNTTEAAFLLDRPCVDRPVSPAAATEMLERLSHARRTAVLITGLPVEGLGICNVGLDRTGEGFAIVCDYLGGSYPGTGDIFTSVAAGELLRGAPLRTAAGVATVFVEKCIALTLGSGEPERDGVFLEAALPALFTDECHRAAVDL